MKQLWEGVPLPGGELLQGIVTQLRADWKWHVESWPYWAELSNMNINCIVGAVGGDANNVWASCLLLYLPTPQTKRKNLLSGLGLQSCFQEELSRFRSAKGKPDQENEASPIKEGENEYLEMTP